jgi:hypothetical protein
MMNKGGREDWINRDEGRLPTKGAMAAERASAGLGTSDDDDASPLLPAPKAAIDAWPKPAGKSTRTKKAAPGP